MGKRLFALLFLLLSFYGCAVVPPSLGKTSDNSNDSIASMPITCPVTEPDKLNKTTLEMPAMLEMLDMNKVEQKSAISTLFCSPIPEIKNRVISEPGTQLSQESASNTINPYTVCDDGYIAPWQDYRAEFINDASFAVTPIGVVFIYPTGLADCVAAGTVFLNVPYEVLHGLLNPIYFPNYFK